MHRLFYIRISVPFFIYFTVLALSLKTPTKTSRVYIYINWPVYIELRTVGEIFEYSRANVCTRSGGGVPFWFVLVWKHPTHVNKIPRNKSILNERGVSSRRILTPFMTARIVKIFINSRELDRVDETHRDYQVTWLLWTSFLMVQYAIFKFEIYVHGLN